MTSEDLRKLAEQLRVQAKVEKTIKTSQVVEAAAGLARLKTKLGLP